METRRGLLKKATIGALALLPNPIRALSSCLGDEPNTGTDLKQLYHVKVNCAGPVADGFSADQPYRRGSWGYSRGGQYFACDSVANDYGIPTAIKTLRYSCGAPLHYKFDVPNGYYRVKMYFASPNELYGPRIADVVLNGNLVLPNFHPFPVATGVMKQFDNTPVSDGLLDITFRSINDACIINAIEIEQTSRAMPPKPAARTKPAAGGLVRIDHDDLMISYYGAWMLKSNAHGSNTAGNALDFTFKGPVVRWVGSKNSDHGIAEVYVDGALQQKIDTYAAAPVLNEVLYEKRGLSESGYHTFRILITRDKHPNSADTYQEVSALESRAPFDAADQDADSAFQEVALIEARKKPFLAPVQWRPVRYAATAPVAAVTLHDGMFRLAFERNINYQVTNWNMDSTWTRWLPGANDGRRMAAAGNILRWVDHPTLRLSLDSLLSSVASRQRADGYALPYPDSDMAKVTYGANNERMSYDRRNFTLGLIEAGQVNPSALHIARRFQDWLYASPYVNTMLDGALGIMGDQPNMSMYFSAAGKDDDVIVRERYWRQDWWLDQLKDQQPVAISRFPLNRSHSYAAAPWAAYCDSYRATGDPKCIEAMLGAWQAYRDNFVHLGGSAAICEDCDNAYPAKSYYLHKHTGENCGGALWIDFNHRLLQLYPDQEKFAAEIERTLYNVTLANQDAAGNIRYHTNLVETKDTPRAIGTCCEVTNTVVLARVPEFIYSIAGDGVYVNLYSPSTITWNHAGRKATLTSSTRFPEDARVSLTFSSSGPLPMKIRLRIPSWASGNVAVRVSGQNTAIGIPGTYVTLARTWSPGDTISFEIPMRLRMTRYTGFDRHPDQERYGLEFGPLLMSLAGGTHLNFAPGNLIANLSPLPGSPLEFSVAGHPGSRFVPYVHIQDETFTSFPTVG
jgi:Beta-L-arabinofuranosidase, GH127/Malectin domain